MPPLLGRGGHPAGAGRAPAGSGRGRAGADQRQKVSRKKNVGLDKFRMGIHSGKDYNKEIA